MTEDEAKTKWCPHYQVTSTDDDDNRSTRFDPATKTYSATLKDACCLGSACMAWRWNDERNPDWRPRHGMMSVGYEEHPDDRPSAWRKSTTDGFCGLAGRP